MLNYKYINDKFIFLLILISSSHVPAPLFFCSLHELPRILPIHEPPSGAASSSGTSPLLPAGLEVPHCTRGGDTAAGRQQGRAGATGLQQAGDGAGGGGRGLACSHLGRTLGARAALSQRAAGGAASVGEEGGQGRRHEHTMGRRQGRHDSWGRWREEDGVQGEGHAGRGVAERGGGQAWKTTLVYQVSELRTVMDRIEIHIVSVISS